MSVSLLSHKTTLSDERQDISVDIGKLELSIKKSIAHKKILDKQAAKLAVQIDNLRIRAAKVAQQTQEQELALSKINSRLSHLKYKKEVTQRHLKQLQANLAHSILALVRLQRQPTAAILIGTKTILDSIRSVQVLAVAVPALEKDAEKLRKLLRASRSVQQNFEIELRRRKSVIAALSTQRKELKDLLKNRAAREYRLRRAGEAEGTRLSILASKAKDLHSLMQRLKQELPHAQFDPEGHGTRVTNHQMPYRNKPPRRDLATKMARALAAAQPKTSDSTHMLQKHLMPTNSLPKQKLALAPQIQKFSSLRGQLRAPVYGTPISRYGESSKFGSRVQGITIRTQQGAQVIAPYQGRVVFAGPFRNYGLILIIAHGEGYHTLLAGLSNLQAVVGQELLTGEPTGTMGGENKRSLYIELRRKGKPIDPNPWWSANRKKASG